MNYKDFEQIISKNRLQRYLIASNYNSKAALTLYRNNLRISQEMFTIISCFEVALRNSIDKILTKQLGPEWLKYSHSKLLASLDFGSWKYMFAKGQ